MVNTNLLLALGFSAITNFANRVPIPQEDIPTSATNLHHYRVGSPRAPVDLGVTGPHGTLYQLTDGVVQCFRSSQNFFGEEDTNVIAAKYTGKSALTSNEVVLLASNVLQRLVQPPYRLTNGPPKIQQAGFYQGKQVRQIPFFVVEWPKLSPRGLSMSARVEIDGRTGRIVDLNLWGLGFQDRPFEEAIKKKVRAPERVKPKRPPDHAGSPKPTTDYVSQSITNWLAFCSKLGLEPGSQRSLADVDWERTFLYSKWGIHSNGMCVAPFWRIKFKNGAYFESIDGTVFSHCSADAAFLEDGTVRWFPEWGGAFEGRPTKRLDDLVRGLQARISERLGLPASFFEQSSPRRSSWSEMLPGHPFTRAKVCWRRLPPQPDADETVEDFRGYFTAEFDLQTGETKSVLFHCYYPQWSEEILQALRTNK